MQNQCKELVMLNKIEHRLGISKPYPFFLKITLIAFISLAIAIPLVDNSYRSTLEKTGWKTINIGPNFSDYATAPSGKLWVGISGNVYALDDDIAIDSQGNIWKAKFGEGISIFNGESWKIINSQNSELLDDRVREISFDLQGIAWIGSNVGVQSFDGSTWVNHTLDFAQLEQCCNDDIEIGLDGKVWISNQEGLHMLDNNVWTSIRFANGRVRIN